MNSLIAKMNAEILMLREANRAARQGISTVDAWFDQGYNNDVLRGRLMDTMRDMDKIQGFDKPLDLSHPPHQGE